MPDLFTRSDGSTGNKPALHNSPPARAFFQDDLYSTFFGTEVNDEIERKLFGDIDTFGSIAVKAFVAGDPGECHQNFENLFKYIDVQKIRTPKGLAWLRAQYPNLTQNQLMMEMQAVRYMNCTIWTEGVREIVSAADSEIKFIISDHPVTTFNLAIPPGSTATLFPNAPGIELKGTQTIFPLDRQTCLILTNYEYASSRVCDPLSKRTFARRFGHSMVKTDSFIRKRSLSASEVHQINRIIRTGAHKYVAAGDKNWLPKPINNAAEWKQAAEVLRPPSDELFGFGGEIFAKFEDGHVHYQDAFGRTEKASDFLQRPIPDTQPKDYDTCPCGSGEHFITCCKHKPLHLRTAWDQLSIRERNLALWRGIESILELTPDKDWIQVRYELTDKKIADIYTLYAALWPKETNLLALLPKPDGKVRAVYTGLLHPQKIRETALSSSLLFEELLIQHPFINPRAMKADFDPTKHPEKFRQEAIKSLLFFFQVIPLVEQGIINLFPDPWVVSQFEISFFL